MNTIKKVFKIIMNPFSTFGLGKFSDRVVDFISKHKYVAFLLSFLITGTVIFIKYFI